MRSGQTPLTSPDSEREPGREAVIRFLWPKCWQAPFCGICSLHLHIGQNALHPLLTYDSHDSVIPQKAPDKLLNSTLFIYWWQTCRAAWYGSPPAAAWQQINTTSSMLIIAPSAAETTSSKPPNLPAVNTARTHNNLFTTEKPGTRMICSPPDEPQQQASFSAHRARFKLMKLLLTHMPSSRCSADRNSCQCCQFHGCLPHSTLIDGYQLVLGTNWLALAVKTAQLLDLSLTTR